MKRAIYFAGVIVFACLLGFAAYKAVEFATSDTDTTATANTSPATTATTSSPPERAELSEGIEARTSQRLPAATSQPLQLPQPVPPAQKPSPPATLPPMELSVAQLRQADSIFADTDCGTYLTEIQQKVERELSTDSSVWEAWSLQSYRRDIEQAISGLTWPSYELVCGFRGQDSRNPGVFQQGILCWNMITDAIWRSEVYDLSRQVRTGPDSDVAITECLNNIREPRT